MFPLDRVVCFLGLVLHFVHPGRKQVSSFIPGKIRPSFQRHFCSLAWAIGILLIETNVHGTQRNFGLEWHLGCTFVVGKLTHCLKDA